MNSGMRSVYDPDQRHAATIIGQRHPSWVVMWGTGSRRFWAFGRFPTPHPVVIHAGHPQELVDRMRAAELAIRPPPGPG